MVLRTEICGRTRIHFGEALRRLGHIWVAFRFAAMRPGFASVALLNRVCHSAIIAWSGIACQSLSRSVSVICSATPCNSRTRACNSLG